MPESIEIRVEFIIYYSYEKRGDCIKNCFIRVMVLFDKLLHILGMKDWFHRKGFKDLLLDIFASFF